MLTYSFIGIRGIMISACPATADTPRAHITNMAAMGTFSKHGTKL